VLVERPLARGAAERLSSAGSENNSRYAATASSGVDTTSSSLPGSNHRSIPSTGFETIAAPEAASSNGLLVADA